MEIGNEDRFSPRDKMVKKKEEQQHGIQASALDAKQAEQWEDRERYWKTTSINSSSLRKQETKGNDLKNNDTWMWVAKDKIRWKEMQKYYMRIRSERC